MAPRNPDKRDKRALTGDQLRALRESVGAGFHQTDMATLMGIGRVAYNRLEMRGGEDIPLDRAIAARCLISAKKSGR